MRNRRKIFNRFTALYIIMLIVTGLITNRLFNMQIINGEIAKEKADSSSIRDLSEPAPRGEILDRKGETLASNIASYDLVYNETEESSENFFETMANLFSFLQLTNEVFNDKFAIKINESSELYFDFQSKDPEVIRIRELRWKKDRGIDDYLLKNDYGKTIGKTSVNELNDEEKNKLDEYILSISPSEMFSYLIRHYGIYDILKLDKESKKELLKKSNVEIANEVLSKYSLDLIRKFIVIKDEVNLKLYQSDKSVKLASNMKKDSAFIFMQRSNLLPGVKVQLNPVRVYPYSSLASHVLGYIAPISEFNKDGYESRGYDVNQDLVGTIGIEGAYENELKGNKTVSTVKIDRQGRTIQELFKLEGYPGNTIQISIDKDLQYAAEKGLEKRLKELQTIESDHGNGNSSKNATRGAVVVLNVKTGKVLALASYPSFDPNVFVLPGKLPDDLYERYFNPDLEKFSIEIRNRLGISKGVDDLFPKDERGVRQDYYDLYPKPFLNYATQGLSPVGSIFKPFTAIFGLEEGVIDKSTVLYDTGVYERPELGGYKAENNDGIGWGEVDLIKALTVSSNYFFLEVGYRLYEKLGLNAISDWCWKLGLGHNPDEGVKTTTGIEIEENVYGNVFSLQGRRDYLANYGQYLVNSITSKGVSRTGEKFKPLDLSINEGDSEKTKKIKSDLKTNIYNWFKDIPLDNLDQEVLYNSLYSVLYSSINAIIHDIPEEKRSSYEIAEFYAREGANYITYDIIGEMKTPVNVMNSAIGQGDSQLTILQIANALSTVVNGGTRYRTSLVEKIIDPEGNVIKEIAPEVLENVPLSKSNIEYVKQGMDGVNNSPSGSGYKYFHEEGNEFPIKTGGKTGTAEYFTNMFEKEYIGRHQYGTYIAFAPYDDPEIVVASIVYDSVHGSYTIPIAKSIFEEYFEEEIKKKNPEYKRSTDFILQPTFKVEPSLLKLTQKNKDFNQPLVENYTPGMEVPANINKASSNTNKTTTTKPENEEETTTEE